MNYLFIELVIQHSTDMCVEVIVKIAGAVNYWYNSFNKFPNYLPNSVCKALEQFGAIVRHVAMQ